MLSVLLEKKYSYSVSIKDSWSCHPLLQKQKSSVWPGRSCIVWGWLIFPPPLGPTLTLLPATDCLSFPYMWQAVCSARNTSLLLPPAAAPYNSQPREPLLSQAQVPLLLSLPPTPPAWSTEHLPGTVTDAFPSNPHKGREHVCFAP